MDDNYGEALNMSTVIQGALHEMPQPATEDIVKKIEDKINQAELSVISKVDTNSRFDLEQEILDCWRITDDIRMIHEFISDSHSTSPSVLLTKVDAVANMLIGLEQLYDLKFNRTFKTFEDVIKQR